MIIICVIIYLILGVLTTAFVTDEGNGDLERMGISTFATLAWPMLWVFIFILGIFNLNLYLADMVREWYRQKKN